MSKKITDELLYKYCKTVDEYITDKIPNDEEINHTYSEEFENKIKKIKKLEKNPIVIKTLNTRVDTARDLVLKLYNTTNEIIKTAELAENCMVYGNRFRSSYTDIDRGLDEARKSFFKGDYKKSLDVSIKAISLVDKNFYQELVSIYDK